MDAIKVIKKHGQPGGLPVMTVYVDPEAPGEGGGGGGEEQYDVVFSTSNITSTDKTKYSIVKFPESIDVLFDKITNHKPIRCVLIGESFDAIDGDFTITEYPLLTVSGAYPYDYFISFKFMYPDSFSPYHKYRNILVSNTTIDSVT